MSERQSTKLSMIVTRSPLRWFIGLLLLFFPTWLMRPVVNSFGHVIAPGARIGFSLLICDRLLMSSGSRVGHLNFVQIRRLLIREKAQLGHLNFCKGPLSLRLEQCSVIGNRNTVSRAPHGVTYGAAQLRMGRLAKVTASHSLDCTKSIRLGDYSTLAGKGSQLWTHGYAHAKEGPERYRVDGSITIGNNVYLGSSVIVTGGVTICDGASIGVGACVSKHLTEAGFYVSGPLRMLPVPPNPTTRADMELVAERGLIEVVYHKRDAD